MSIDDLQTGIGTSLPFAFAFFVLWVGGKVNVFARRAIKSFDAGIELTPSGEQVPVAFSTYLYDHLSYMFGGFTAVVSCVSLTLIAQRPLLAALGAVVGLVPLIAWVVLWQSLSEEEIRGTKGRGMRISSWSMIVVVWGLSLYAQLFPLHPGTAGVMPGDQIPQGYQASGAK